ncbi:MAG: hypothetical protein KAI17_22280 [Thiotrichaceae bacterium]|nr:hypothetical protein [Thiotrichaceae bacterium]
MPLTPSHASTRKQTSLLKQSTHSNHDHQPPQSADKKKVNHGKNILFYSMLSGFAMVTTLFLMTGDPEVEKKQYKEAKIVKLTETSTIHTPKSISASNTIVRQISPNSYGTVFSNSNTALTQQSNYSPVKVMTTDQPNLQRQKYETQQQKILVSIENRNIKRQQEYKKSRQLQQQRQQVNLLISNARNYLRRTPLSHQSLNEALAIHKELTLMTQQDLRVINLFQQIIAAYGEFATYQKDTENYQEALATIQQGLELDKNNLRLIRIKEDISAFISTEGKDINQPKDTASL